MSSTKIVTFKLNISLNENSQNQKSFNSLDDKEKNKQFEKKRNSKLTNSSFEVTSTKNSIYKSRRSRQSIYFSDLKIPKENYQNIRIDAYGNEIKKGEKEKKYKVTFIDQISPEKIAEVILIENNFNKQEEEICKCSSCFIF